MKKVFIKILFTSLFFSTTTPAELYLLAKSVGRPLMSQFSSKPSPLFSTKANDAEKIKMPHALQEIVLDQKCSDDTKYFKELPTESKIRQKAKLENFV